MSGTADHLLELMFEWMKVAEECSSNLRGLAEELETLRKDCNIAETVGNTVNVAGTVVSILAIPFTGGLSLAVGGAVAGILGAGVSLGTKITEKSMSSSKLERVKEIDKRCNKITADIQHLFNKLREECPSSCKDERDKYIVEEFLKAMLRRSKLDVGTDVNVWVNSIVKSNTVEKTIPTSPSLISDVRSVLSMFSLELEGTLRSETISPGGKQMGSVVAIGSAAKFLGGVVGLAFSVPEAITNWTEAINNKHDTEASTSLRDTAQKISEAVKNLADTYSRIKEMLEKKVREEEGELKMAMINCRTANKWVKPRDRALIDLIQNNDLDVLLITETWFLMDIFNNDKSILPPGYSIIHNPRFYGRSGGVAIVHRSNLICERVPFHTTSTFEFVAATVTPPRSTETVLVLSIYRPPGGSATDLSRDFLTKWRVFLNDLNRPDHKNVIIGGDFNIWVDRPEMPTTQEFLTILLKNDLAQHVSQPTHRQGHIMDLVLSKPSVRITNMSIQANEFSDRSIVLFRAKFKNMIHAIKI